MKLISKWRGGIIVACSGIIRAHRGKMIGLNKHNSKEIGMNITENNINTI